LRSEKSCFTAHVVKRLNSACDLKSNVTAIFDDPDVL